MGTRPMAREEGAALELQLRAMLASLGADNPEVRRVMDQDTAELVLALEMAHVVSIRIMKEHPALADRKGVRLARVQTLADRGTGDGDS